ncbi:MAG: SH3 domain-containing protein [Clostridium sp.]|nr:SH3 domain-containing protein [Clostridium sp.]
MMMKKHILWLCVMVLALTDLRAQTKAEGDSAYVHEEYEKAIAIYSGLLENGESADLYYNIGNCYYKTDQIALSILNYERAAMLDPGDSGIRYNLTMARNKTVDKIVPQSEMFFITWFNQMTDWMSIDAWAFTAIALFVLMLVMLMGYFFAGRLLWKKISFYVALACLPLIVLCNVFAGRQKSRLTERSSAIIMQPSVVVRSTPTQSGTDLFILHEGTRVEIVDDSMEQWKEVKIADGKVGWVSVSEIERI